MTRRNRHSRNQAAPGWVWMLFGLGLGLIVATVVYLRTPPTPAVGTASAAPAPPEAQTPAPAPRAAAAAAPTPRVEAAAPAESRFAFYEILPQFEVVVPEADARAAPAVRSRPVEEPGSYLLQAGSFSAAADADRLQANLALRGIESRVQRVTIDDDVFHRVRIGPISDLATLNRTRGQLRDAGIDPLVMKAPQ